jgi:hypothetical protein
MTIASIDRKLPHSIAFSGKCSGLRTVEDGLANSRISQPTIIANKQGSWLTIMANGPTLLCEELANKA